MNDNAMQQPLAEFAVDGKTVWKSRAFEEISMEADLNRT
jgi:hypothetical protein